MDPVLHHLTIFLIAFGISSLFRSVPSSINNFLIYPHNFAYVAVRNSHKLYNSFHKKILSFQLNQFSLSFQFNYPEYFSLINQKINSKIKRVILFIFFFHITAPSDKYSSHFTHLKIDLAFKRKDVIKPFI